MRRMIAIGLAVAAGTGGVGTAQAGKPRIAAPPKLNGTLSTDGKAALIAGKGASVVRLRPGWYTVTIQDQTAAKGFALAGPGLNKATGVRFRGAVIWGVKLRRGTYRYGATPGRLTHRLVIS